MNQMSRSAEAATLRLDAMTQQLKRELEALEEKMHYTHVKKENDNENDAAEQIALLKGTLGTCLFQQSEMQQSIAGLTNRLYATRLGKAGCTGGRGPLSGNNEGPLGIW